MPKLEYYSGSSWVSVGTISSVTAGTGLSGGTITDTGTIALANTAVTAGTYVIPTITVNSQGQITSASTIGIGANNTYLKSNGTSLFWGTGQNGTVTSVGVTGSTGISISGSPITSSGTISLSLNSELQGISGLSNYGFIARTGVGTYSSRALISGSGISITDSTGAISSPIISTSNIPISTLSGYPNNSSLFLRGDGAWGNPTFTLPMSLLTSDYSNGYITIKNSSYSAIATGFQVVNIYDNGIQFGLNNSASEGYAFAGSGMAFKIGTNNISRFRIDTSGNIDCFYGNITTSGVINATTGTLKANNISSHNSGSILFASDINMNNKIITNAYSLSCNYKIKSSEYGYEIYSRASSNYLDLRGAFVRSSKTSAIIETNSNNETASIVMNGDYIQTIQTFDDLGFIFTDEDADPQTTWQSYISSNGSLVTSSSSIKKQSIRKKSNNNYLDRIKKLNIYSYSLKTEIFENDSEKTKIRKYFKNKQLHVGLLSEEVMELFDNCVDNFKTIEFSEENKDEVEKSIKGYVPSITDEEYKDYKNKKRGDIIGIKYDSLLCYTILALQELSKKFDNYINKVI